MRTFACLLFALTLCMADAATGQPGAPSTEQFMNALGTCAANMNLKLSGDLIGSIKTFYEGSKTQGTMSLQNAPEFLKLFPDSERAAAYRIYVECVLKILK